MIEFVEVDALPVVVFVQAEAEAHGATGDPLLPGAADFVGGIVKATVDVEAAMIDASVEGEADGIEAGGDQE